jgi:hypothetical protein
MMLRHSLKPRSSPAPVLERDQLRQSSSHCCRTGIEKDKRKRTRGCGTRRVVVFLTQLPTMSSTFYHSLSDVGLAGKTIVVVCLRALPVVVISCHT